MNYISEIVLKLNSLGLEFYGIPIVFDAHIVANGVQTIASEREKEIFFMYATDKYTLEEIGKVFGVTGERIRQILKHLVQKLEWRWKKYVTISLSDAEKIIRSESKKSFLTAERNGFSMTAWTFDDFDSQEHLSTRTYCCIKRAGYETMDQLLNATEDDLIKIRNYGRKSHQELMDALARNGLSLRRSE